MGMMMDNKQSTRETPRQTETDRWLVAIRNAADRWMPCITLRRRESLPASDLDLTFFQPLHAKLKR